MADAHYDIDVNKKDLNVGALARQLNDRWENGWALKQLYEKDGNTVVVYERRSAG